MKQYFVLLFACMALWGCGGQDQIETPPLKIIDQIDFSHVHIRDNFWSPRLAKHTSATLPVCIDQIENQTGRMQNFENAARGTGKHSGIFFDDSDVYKALEGIAYSLINNPDPELEKKADEWIDKIAGSPTTGRIYQYILHTDRTRQTLEQHGQARDVLCRPHDGSRRRQLPGKPENGNCSM